MAHVWQACSTEVGPQLSQAEGTSTSANEEAADLCPVTLGQALLPLQQVPWVVDKGVAALCLIELELQASALLPRPPPIGCQLSLQQ